MDDDARIMVTRFDGMVDELRFLAHNHDIASERAQFVIARAAWAMTRMGHLIEELLDASEHGDECRDECICMWPVRAIEWERIQLEVLNG